MNERRIKKLISKTEKESVNINKDVDKLVERIYENLDRTQKTSNKNIEILKKELENKDSVKQAIASHLNEVYDRGEDISWETRKSIARLKRDALRRKKKIKKHLKKNYRHLQKTGHQTKEGLEGIVTNHISPLSVEMKDTFNDRIVPYAKDAKEHVIGFKDKVKEEGFIAKEKSSDFLNENLIPLATKVGNALVDKVMTHKFEVEEDYPEYDDIYIDEDIIDEEPAYRKKKSKAFKKALIGLGLAKVAVAGAIVAKARLIDHRSVRSYAYELGYKGLDYKNKTGFIENDYEMNALLLENAKMYSSTPYSLPLKYRNKYELLDSDYKDVYLAENISGVINRVIVYFHTGLFWLQPDDGQYKYASSLADELEAKVYIPIYPLAPTHDYKEIYAFLEDFYKKLLEDNKDSEIVFVGNSNGALLALGLAMKAKEDGLKVPETIVLNSPILETKMDNPFMDDLAKDDPIHRLYDVKLRLQYFGNHEDEKNYLISPLYGSLEGLKNIVVNTGTNDIFYSDALDLLDKSAADNKVIDYYEYKHMIHDFVQLNIPEAYEAMATLRAILGINDFEYIIEEEDELV